MEPPECEAVARRLAKQLPFGFHFEAIRCFGFGARQRHVALYRQNNATFALIPSATPLLGYDPDRPWEPNPDELESWRDDADAYGFDMNIREYIAQATARIRPVELAPFLIETAAVQCDWEGVDRAARLAEAGFRFPTIDEWEYACGGGAPTLFRWGDHVPCDRAPRDLSVRVAERRRRWELTGRKLPPEEFALDWNLHRQPNAFGLSIAFDPRQDELVSEPGITRGRTAACRLAPAQVSSSIGFRWPPRFAKKRPAGTIRNRSTHLVAACWSCGESAEFRRAPGDGALGASGRSKSSYRRVRPHR